MKKLLILSFTLQLLATNNTYAQDEEYEDVKFDTKNLIISGSLYALAILEGSFFPIGKSPKPIDISYKHSYKNPLIVVDHSSYGGILMDFGMYSKRKTEDKEMEECIVGESFNVSESRLFEENIQYYDLKETHDFNQSKKWKSIILFMTAGAATLYLGGSIKIVDNEQFSSDDNKETIVDVAKITRTSLYVAGGLLLLSGLLEFRPDEIDEAWDKYRKKYNPKYSIRLRPVIMEPKLIERSRQKKNLYSYGFNLKLNF